MNYSFQTPVKAESVSQSCASYITDFNDVTAAQNFSDVALNKPYLTAGPAGVGSYIHNGSFKLSSIAMPATDSGFDVVRSIGFSYRPWFEPNTDYYERANFHYTISPTVILFNTRTLESLYIRPSSPWVSQVGTGVVATLAYYQPLSINVQGRVPFYANLVDTIEMCVVNPTSNNGPYGKLILNLFNFDSAPWYQTNIDSLYTQP